MKACVVIRWAAPLLLFAAPTSGMAQETAAPALAEALSGVRWQTPPPTPAMMEGKSTIVLVYATWCPLCNEWSGECFASTRDAAVDSPVNIIAVSADGGFDAGYISERKFVAPNIFHAHDPGIDKKLGFSSNLFWYAVFDPDGKLIDKGQAGAKMGAKTFVLAHKMQQDRIPGEFRIFTKEMSPAVKNVLAPIEMGQSMTDKDLLKARGSLSEDEQKELNAAVRGYLDKAVESCREKSKGDVLAQIEAYQLAVAVAASFGSTPQGKTCQAYINHKEADAAFKQEIAAAKAYHAMLDKAAGAPRSAGRLMRMIASRYEGTHYGGLAAKAAETGQLP